MAKWGISFLCETKNWFHNISLGSHAQTRRRHHHHSVLKRENHSLTTYPGHSKQAKKVSTSKGKTKNKLASCFICAKRRVIAFVFVFDRFYFILKRFFSLYFKNYRFFICHVFHCFFHLDRNRGYVLRSRKKIKLVTRCCCNATEFSFCVFAFESCLFSVSLC